MNANTAKLAWMGIAAACGAGAWQIGLALPQEMESRTGTEMVASSATLVAEEGWAPKAFGHGGTTESYAGELDQARAADQLAYQRDGAQGLHEEDPGPDDTDQDRADWGDLSGSSGDDDGQHDADPDGLDGESEAGGAASPRASPRLRGDSGGDLRVSDKPYSPAERGSAGDASSRTRFQPLDDGDEDDDLSSNKPFEPVDDGDDDGDDTSSNKPFEPVDEEGDDDGGSSSNKPFEPVDRGDDDDDDTSSNKPFEPVDDDDGDDGGLHNDDLEPVDGSSDASDDASSNKPFRPVDDGDDDDDGTSSNKPFEPVDDRDDDGGLQDDDMEPIDDSRGQGASQRGLLLKPVRIPAPDDGDRSSNKPFEPVDDDSDDDGLHNDDLEPVDGNSDDDDDTSSNKPFQPVDDGDDDDDGTSSNKPFEPVDDRDDDGGLQDDDMEPIDDSRGQGASRRGLLLKPIRIPAPDDGDRSSNKPFEPVDGDSDDDGLHNDDLEPVDGNSDGDDDQSSNKPFEPVGDDDDGDDGLPNDDIEPVGGDSDDDGGSSSAIEIEIERIPMENEQQLVRIHIRAVRAVSIAVLDAEEEDPRILAAGSADAGEWASAELLLIEDEEQPEPSEVRIVVHDGAKLYQGAIEIP